MNLFERIVKETEDMDLRVQVYGEEEEKWRHVFLSPAHGELQVYGVRDAFLEVSEEGSNDEVLVRLGGYKTGEETAVEERTYRSLRGAIRRVLTVLDEHTKIHDESECG